MSNAIMQILTRTGQSDKAIDNLAKKLNDFGKGGVSSLAPMLGSWTKLVPAIAAAAGGIETFNKVINSSQTIGDRFTAMQNVMKDSVDKFFNSLTIGDFTVMEQGLDSLIRKSEQYTAILDQLGNTQMSYSAVKSEEDYKFRKAVTGAKSQEKGTPEFKRYMAEAHAAVEEMNKAAAILQQDLVTTLQSAFANNSTLEATDISWESIGNALKANATKWGREGGIDRAKAEYEAYQKEWLEATKTHGEHMQYTYTDESGETKRFAEPVLVPENTKALAAARQEINEKYKDSIVIFAALEKFGDDYLKTLTDQYNEYYTLQAGVEGYRQQLIELGKTQEQTRKALQPLKHEQFFVGGKVTAPTANVGNVLEKQAVRGKSDTVNEAAIKAIPKFEHTMTSSMEVAEEMTQTVTKSIESQEFAVNGLGKAYASLGTLIGGTSGAIMQSLGGIIQAIATLIPAQEAAAIAEGTEVATRSSHHWVEALAAIASVTASVIATFASLPKFETGGVVPGSSYHGDQILARLNSGEVVLNKEQQAALMSRMSDHQEQQGKMQVEFKIKDRDLVGILSNYSSRQSFKL